MYSQVYNVNTTTEIKLLPKAKTFLQHFKPDVCIEKYFFVWLNITYSPIPV